MLGTGVLALLVVALPATPTLGSQDASTESSQESSQHGSQDGSRDVDFGDRRILRIGGYVRTLAGLQQVLYEQAPDSGAGPAERVGLSATVARLEWKLGLSERCSAELHQRAFLRMSSESPGPSRLGLGASVVPRRSVDLRVVAYDGDRLLLEHDLDRLVLRASLGHVDVSVGRQAITWGTGEIFPVADLWANYSPFELDTSQKRGVDAVRALFSRSRDWELEAVLADRGALEDLSAGFRVASYREYVDTYVAIAKQWRELVAMAGTAGTVGSLKLRAEFVGPFDLDQRQVTPPRLSLGLDWLPGGFRLTLEAHFNGTGVRTADQYATHLATSPAVAHGESYLLGRLYTGAAANWKLSELFQLTLTGVCNVQDPSALLAAAFAWSLAQETELTLGTFAGIGTRPVVGAPVRSPVGAMPSLRSEFGSYGRLFYVALASYF